MLSDLKSKKFLYLFFTLVILLAAYGIYAPFVPSKSYIKYVKNASLFLSCIITGFSYLYFFRKESKIWRDFQGKQNKWITALTIPFVTFVGPHAAITIGVPATLNEFISSEGSELYLVESKDDPYYRYRCIGGVDIERNIFLKKTICGIPRDKWNNISRGDTLKLIGKKSIFGLKYNKVVLIKNN